MVYSIDNGCMFIKYEKNLVLILFDGLKDFCDLKVFWYVFDQKWVMVVLVDKEMCFYLLENLKEWIYMSGWGEGYGVQFSQFECLDMVEFLVDGNLDYKKWVLIVNVNLGCYFGGSVI